MAGTPFSLVLSNTALLEILLEYLCLVHRQIFFNIALKRFLKMEEVNEHYKAFRKVKKHKNNTLII